MYMEVHEDSEHRRTSVATISDKGKIALERHERRPAGGRWSADTAAYKLVREDVEHHRTFPVAPQILPGQKSFWSVASGVLRVTAGAQDPQRTWKYVRNPSTAGRPQRVARDGPGRFLSVVGVG
ncbi:MAG: hypothetical protein WD397_00470 [Wenzhouxiangellaceae bacterium]